MRLVSYNILDGGVGRALALADVIQQRRPDVVVLVEADDAAVIDQIAARLEMDKIRGEGNKPGSAAAILSRWPIRESINHAALRPAITKTFLEATIIAPGGAEWTLAALHLQARAFEEDEQLREREIAEVLDAMAVHRQSGRPHLLAGDFNSNSPAQEIDPSRCKPRTREAWEKNGGRIPRRVVQRLLNAGYVDSLHAVHGPAAARMVSFTTDHPGQRLDYVFTFGVAPKRLRDAWIDQSPAAHQASDHFPIGVEIEEDLATDKPDAA
jgi:endonuclease/exonuclease/phosphatase family metal-dependent hydrolase